MAEVVADHHVVRVPLRDRPYILDFGDGLAEAVTERSDVTGRTELSVGEIVARHQQARAADDRALERHVVLARMEQHFRPTTTDPGFDVVSENRFFSDRGGVEWEELSFSVNGTKWGADRPAFPLLQPEKVLSPPLDLRLDADYRYRLDGTETVDGAACYVVRFTPDSLAAGKSLYRGTVWIDRETFRRRKLQAEGKRIESAADGDDGASIHRRKQELRLHTADTLDEQAHCRDTREVCRRQRLGVGAQLERAQCV